MKAKHTNHFFTFMEIPRNFQYTFPPPPVRDSVLITDYKVPIGLLANRENCLSSTQLLLQLYRECIEMYAKPMPCLVFPASFGGWINVAAILRAFIKSFPHRGSLKPGQSQPWQLCAF